VNDARAGDPLIGRVLDGRYLIGARIARGGMASVYEATDTRLDRVCAIKVMHPGLGDDGDFAARFVREARAAAKLSHPNVVSVFDQGDDHGAVFLAMEYVPGHTLRDVIRKEAPLAPLRALALLEPVLSALAAAHRAGLIHRDIKPENVLIADEQHGGRIKVADFGLAKAISTDTQHTATGGVLIGTVSYLAPELVVDGRADARADVYAAGVVLYELLTGHKPHEGESPIQVAYKHVHEDVPAPGAEVDGLPSYVDALVARATSRDRGLRPADAGVFLHQLHMVRQALEDGVVEDPELYADLMPLMASAVSSETAPIEVPDFDDPPAPLEPSAVRLPPVSEHTTAIPPLAPGATVVRPAAVVRRPTRRSRRGPILFVAALLVAALVGGLAWWFGAGRYTATPSVIGLTQAAAQQKLQQAGLEGSVGAHSYSETVPRGQVISTDPDPGARVLDGGTVTLVISLGKERYDVPTLRGKTVDEAQDAILDAHLSFGRTIERFNDRLEEGVVLGSDPPAGTSLKPDTAVNIFVSKGPKPLEIPDFTGEDAKKAKKALEQLGFKVETTEDFSDEVDKGEVISQDPDDGSGFKDDVIQLVVSQGPELVEIPHGLKASGVESATATLQALGFEVDVEQSEGYLGLGYVFSVSPEEGEKVPAGSTVTLYLI